MRLKTNDFKKKRAELDAENAENNILSRTSVILAHKWQQLKEKIVTFLPTIIIRDLAGHDSLKKKVRVSITKTISVDFEISRD